MCRVRVDVLRCVSCVAVLFGVSLWGVFYCDWLSVCLFVGVRVCVVVCLFVCLFACACMV